MCMAAIKGDWPTNTATRQVGQQTSELSNQL